MTIYFKNTVKNNTMFLKVFYKNQSYPFV